MIWCPTLHALKHLVPKVNLHILWNRLPADPKNAKTIPLVKKMLKNYLLDINL